jgi:RsiW-degrading membrane proteinase PrsW (M82 family)
MDKMSKNYPFITGIIIIAATVVGMIFANRAARKKKNKHQTVLTAISGFFALVVLVLMLGVLMLDAI